MKLNTILTTLLGTTGLFVIGSCTMNTAEPIAESGSIKAEPVKVIPVEYRSISKSEEVTATINPFEETNLAPALSGRINSVKVNVNDKVKKGEILAELDATQLNQTRVQYQTLKKDLARMDTLLQYGTITQQAYDQQKSALKMQEVLLENLENNTFLRSPYTGIITGRYYNEGELFSPTPNTASGKAALLTLMQIDRLKVYVNLPEKYFPVVHPGIAAELRTDVYGKESFEGKVFRVYPTIDPMTRTFRVEIHMQNPELRLRPGMFAKLSLSLAERQALLVPSVAVLQQSGTNQRYLFINQNGKAQKIIVTLGERYDDMQEIITSELKGGEELIWAGQKRLNDGTPVEIIQD